jgi:hypothetical protein
MDAYTLCTLLAQRIPPEQFQIRGEEVYFIDSDANNKPVDAPHTSPYDTPENRAIVEDVISNYDTLETAYLAEELKAKTNAETIAKLELIDKQSIRGIREWIAVQPTASKFVIDLEAEAATERVKILK